MLLRLKVEDSTLDSSQAIMPTTLFSLPAEVRLQIYSYLIPTPSYFIPVRYSRLRWLSASRRLFQDAAPLFYGVAPFKISIVTPNTFSLEEQFVAHVRLTYGDDAPEWVLKDAMAVLRYADITVGAGVLREGSSMVCFEKILGRVQDFLGLKGLRVELTPGSEVRELWQRMVDEHRHRFPESCGRIVLRCIL